MKLFGLMTQKEVKKQIEEAIKAAMLEHAPNWLLQWADAERYSLRDPSVYGNQADLFRRVSWVLQAVEITAQASAVTRFDVKSVTGEQEPKDIPNHPFEKLLRRPNPLDSRFEFLNWTVTMYKLTGNCYWWLNRPDEFTPPVELWGIPSHMIIPVPDANLYIRGYMYYPGNGREILLPPHEIVHFRRTNPANRFVGLSAVEAIANAAIGDASMQDWSTRLFRENNGRIPGILTFEQMVADPAWEKIKDEAQAASRDRNMLMLRGVGQGVNWLQGAVTQKEMDFLGSRKFTKEEIFGVLAPGLFSMLSENATEANSRTGRAAFNELTLYPMHVMMAEKITNEILPVYKKNSPSPERTIIGMFEDVRMADKAMELDEIARYSETHTIAEIREYWYGDIPLGDERDELLPAQIKPESGGIQEPPTPPTAPGMPAEGTPMEKPETDAANPPKEEPKEEPVKAVLDDLAKWERKATKRVGRTVEFLSYTIPQEVADAIGKELEACKTETAVKMVFERARVRIKPKPAVEVVTTPTPAYDNSALITLAQSLNNLASAYKSQTTTTPPNIYLPAQTFNMPQTEHVTQIHMPNQPAPQTTVHVSPTVEAARTPDVHVSNPVNIHQTVEPASPPNIDAPITINQTIEPAAVPAVEIPTPVTNVNIENKLPDQPAPVANVTVENKVEPTPVKFSPTIEQPAPVVNVTNEVKTPKVKRTRSKVVRDAGNNIEGQDTEYEYKDDE